MATLSRLRTLLAGCNIDRALCLQDIPAVDDKYGKLGYVLEQLFMEANSLITITPESPSNAISGKQCTYEFGLDWTVCL